MPYSGPGDKSLPQHVKELPEDKRATWVAVWMDTYQDCNDSGGEDCEGQAFKQANGAMLKENDDTSEFAYGPGVEPAPGGPERCVCPDCGHVVEKERGVPCRSIKCSECGAMMEAEVEVVEDNAGKKGPGKGWHGPPAGTHGKGSLGGRSFGSRREADDWASAQSGLNPELSDEESASLEMYKGDGYYDINDDLREAGYSEAYSDDVERIDAALERSSLPEPVTVYRGIDVEMLDDYDEDLTGSTWTDDAFVSTALYKGVAEQRSTGATIEIRLPKGAQALYMDRWKLQSRPSETELLLARGKPFTVLSDTGYDSDPREIVMGLEE